ncbi:hypothetical protein DPMN_003086 [Dreissena polymorpha]|uniref:Uncharacterized protein n=1 Tax=Dreissena polymorpha TaxID=45954 RepID=A0A9D4MNK5_DREPO|nr:hypothetical protein DPMN_003086 [Dreissena polymorpha]
MDDEVQFITVSQSQLAKGRKLKLQHSCNAIAYLHDDLYICSNTALYKYRLSGKQVCRLYEDTSEYKTGKNHGGFILITCVICTEIF